jgi:hypothetical protein
MKTNVAGLVPGLAIIHQQQVHMPLQGQGEYALFSLAEVTREAVNRHGCRNGDEVADGGLNPLSLFRDRALIHRFSPDGFRDQQTLEQCFEDRQSVGLGECQQRARVGYDDHRPSISETN